METIDAEVLSALIHAKIRQLPWTKLPERYKELTGDAADWRELKEYVLEKVGIAILPGRISSQSKDQVRRAFDSANFGAFGVPQLMDQYLEWSCLRERNVKSLAVYEVDQENPAPNIQQPDPLSKTEVSQMDRLPKLIARALLREVAVMAQAQDSNGLFQAAPLVASDSKNEATIAQGTSKLMRAALMKEAAEQNARMLEEMAEQHKREGVGRYRPQIEDQDDEE